jgi:hypothetical protein
VGVRKSRRLNTTVLDNRLEDGVEVLRLTHLPVTSSPKKTHGTHFCLRLSAAEGVGQLKN